jgi:hypothetical protein
LIKKKFAQIFDYTLGARPILPGQGQISVPSSQPMQNNAYSPSVTGTRPQVTSAQVTSGYNQTTIPPPGISQYPIPSIAARPQQGSDVDNTLVPQMADMRINQSQDTNQFDVMYFIRSNLLDV